MTHEKNGPAQCEAVRFETGGGGGIRTLVTGVAGETVFETAAFNHSATPPLGAGRLGFQSRPSRLRRIAGKPVNPPGTVSAALGR